MALCLAESLIECRQFNAADQMGRYLRWYRDGYWSSTDVCFDIGSITQDALESFERTGTPFAGSIDPQRAGNGSLMRLAPIPVYFRHTPDMAIAHAGESSRTTHATRAAIDACRYFAGLLIGALNGVRKDELLAPAYHPVRGQWQPGRLDEAIYEVASGSFLKREPPSIRGTGYVVQSLEAALWAFSGSNDFRSGALLAVNLGEDADTTGAIYGQIAGTYYGASAIPTEWRSRLARTDEIETLAVRLTDSSPAAPH